MTEIDANAQLLTALKQRWPGGGGGYLLGGQGVSEFDTSKVQLKVITLEYPGLGPLVQKTPTVLQELTIPNDSDATVTAGFDYSKESTDTSEWHITAGVKATAGASGKAGVPLVAEGEVSASVELDFEYGYNNSHTDTVTWANHTTIEVPPHARIQAEAILTTGSVTNAPFTATLHAYGQVGAHLITSSNGTGPWAWADIETGKGWVNPNFAPLSKPPVDPTALAFVVSGTYTGSVGFYVNIATSPLPPKGS